MEVGRLSLDRPQALWPGIDWSAPWMAPWRAVGQPLEGRILGGESVAQALGQGGPSPVGFVPQAALPAGVAYERFILETGQVPTREVLHDFFNGLCWYRFPQAKRRLNALQAAEIARDGVGPVRGALRDAITVFDENGALLQANPALWHALQARQWERLFGELRPLWTQARLLVWGHALLEKLVTPRKDLTAHVWRAQAPLADGPGLDGVDSWLAQQLTPQALAAKPFTPLPLLGIPGWCEENQDPAFYRDARVFRPVPVRQSP